MSFLWGGGASPGATKQQTSSWGNLQDLFKTGTNLGQKLSTGTTGLQEAGNYWKSLLGGDRAKTAEAVAPAANSAVTQADATKRQEAEMGTSRGGGTNAGNQKRATDTQSQIDTLIGDVKPKAAEGLANVSSMELSDMLGSLSLSEGAASTVGAQSGADLIAAKERTANFVNELMRALI